MWHARVRKKTHAEFWWKNLRERGSFETYAQIGG
jgi:hypothetical protein